MCCVLFCSVLFGPFRWCSDKKKKAWGQPGAFNCWATSTLSTRSTSINCWKLPAGCARNATQPGHQPCCSSCLAPAHLSAGLGVWCLTAQQRSFSYCGRSCPQTVPSTMGCKLSTETFSCSWIPSRTSDCCSYHCSTVSQRPGPPLFPWSCPLTLSSPSRSSWVPWDWSSNPGL